MPDNTNQRSKFAVMCEDDAQDRAEFSDNHKDSRFDISVCKDIEALPQLLAEVERVPDLLVSDLYHNRYSPDSEEAAERTKIIEDRLAVVLDEVKENANRYYEARAVRILKELRNQNRLGDLPVLLYTRQGMLGITDEEISEVSRYGAEWMLKGRKPETGAQANA